MFQSTIVTELLVRDLPPELRELPPDRLGLVLNDIRNLVSGSAVSHQVTPQIEAAAEHLRELRGTAYAALTVIVLSLGIAGGAFAWRQLSPRLRARNRVEAIVVALLVVCSTIAIFTTIGIVLSVLFEAIRFFNLVSITEFLFGLEWSPQMALRADQAGSSGAFGAVPLFAGTALISGIAMLIAVPIGLMSAVYLSEYASRGFRATAKPLLEILAGIPTVVYGFFAALTVAPFVRESGTLLGLDVASESALAAGLVMGIMIIPSSRPCPTTSSTRCRSPCATRPTRWVRRSPRRCGR